MSWTDWRSHFERSAARPLPGALDFHAHGATAAHLHDGEAGTAAVTDVRVPLARVLARFQLGESGEGRIAHEIDRAALPGIDGDYRRALKLFVKEEGRHARILASIVRALGGRLIRRGPSERIFRAVRRMLGVRFKLLVLQIAEIMGGSFYPLLAERLGATPAGAALAEIAADEAHHLRFHAAFLRAQAARPAARVGLRAALWLIGVAALGAVIIENRRDLRAARLPVAAVMRRGLALLGRADRLAFRAGRARDGAGQTLQAAVSA
jgi:hypothetical protein